MLFKVHLLSAALTLCTSPGCSMVALALLTPSHTAADGSPRVISPPRAMGEVWASRRQISAVWMGVMGVSAWKLNHV